MNKRILFIASHRPDRAPGQRYRFEMFRDVLERQGMETELSYLLDASDDALLYAPGNYWGKFRIARNSRAIRRRDLRRIEDADLVVIIREALMTRSTFFEEAVARSGVPMLFDFDDAIWIRDMSAANRRLGFLKDPDKIRRILPLCQGVTAGNDFLAAFARKFNDDVYTVPSTVDSDRLFPLPRPDRPITIGWSGSQTTIRHFDAIGPVLRRLKEHYGDRIRLVTIGARSSLADTLGIDYMPWEAERENELHNALDIGLMPLPDSAWAQGKCAMKLLLYMAMGIPSVAANVGVNADVLGNATCGLLTQSENDWFSAVVRLVEDTELRKSMGQRARKRLVDHYSKHAWGSRYVEIYREVMAKTNAPIERPA